MKRLQLSILMLFGWFFVFYNIERLFEPINLASFVYLLAPACGMVLLAVPRLYRMPPALFLPVALVAVVVLRSAFGYRLDGAAFSLAVTETVAVWITLWLSGHLARGLEEYRSAAATAIFSHVMDCRPLAEVQSEIVREVRRARQYDRPIAVLTLQPVDQAASDTLDRFSNDFKEALLEQYVSARVARCVSEQLRQYDILTQSDDRLIALLPELSREEGLAMAAQLRTQMHAEIGIDLRVGISMFPEDEITAIGLIERAEADVEDVLRSAENSSPLAAQEAARDAPDDRAEGDDQDHTAQLRTGSASGRPRGAYAPTVAR
ncbi:nucleotidyl cyclase domain-containing protein [Roseimaritima sediminicola]|uniref:hypothetical protein n=1 Tax=Roseimaritima sediminicola TaxID=2662066 RepID=UPI0012984D79|nr:hypothetical protein [Roseimaritima sediminicola]